MSGIAGVVYFDGRSPAPGALAAMTSAMARRGPDGGGHWSGREAALGQCMLRTTPESLEERQPLPNEDASVVLVMDGRVDNRDELRRALLGRGALLRDGSDAELALRAYEAWGEDCPARIIGEFVLFAWDARRSRLFGARDAAGCRHFYYHAGRDWFAFASEIKGLLAPGWIEPRLDESRLLDYAVVAFDRDDEVGTFYQDINRLPAGHALSATERGVKTWRWWNPQNLPGLPLKSMGECAEGFRAHLREAVKCRLRGVGPLGAMLSGGLDSSAIVGLASRDLRDELAQPLRTFSLALEEREQCGDWTGGIRHMLQDGWLEPVVLDSGMAAGACGEFLAHFADADEPFVFSRGFPYSLAYAAASKAGCRVIFDGLAGDLHFYEDTRSLDCVVRGRLYARIPALLAAFARHDVEGGARALARRFLAEAAPDGLRAAYRRLRPAPEAGADLLCRQATAGALADKRAARRQAQELLRQADDVAFHASYFTTGLLSFAHEVYGQAALSYGVEPRSPFSDRRLIEFSLQMPVEAKLCAPWYKPVLRLAMAGTLPEPVRWRRDFGRGHPGWDFYRRLVGEVARSAPEIWSQGRIAATLEPWVCRSSLAGEWARYAQMADFHTGYSLYSLAMLAWWLDARQPLANFR